MSKVNVSMHPIPRALALGGPFAFQAAVDRGVRRRPHAMQPFSGLLLSSENSKSPMVKHKYTSSRDRGHDEEVRGVRRQAFLPVALPQMKCYPTRVVASRSLLPPSLRTAGACDEGEHAVGGRRPGWGPAALSHLLLSQP